VFRAQFTIGTVRKRQRLARVATFSEPRDRQRQQATVSVVLAPDHGTLVDQYRHLAPGLAARAARGAPPAQHGETKAEAAGPKAEAAAPGSPAP
jgi:hypothetical protein